MIKLLHAADLHLDSPLVGFSDERRAFLRKALSDIPWQIARLCRIHSCDMLLLSGDIFDGNPTKSSLDTLRQALEDTAVPVFIAPGNHDFCHSNSPWFTEVWPENVHIFTKPIVESVSVPGLDCRVYGAGYQSMDCPGLLEGFRAEGEERYHICVLHGDPVQSFSPYCPITAPQVRDSGLEYLALGHIHKGDSFRAGATLCAWPGCPMGRGYDETGVKGVLLVTVEESAEAEYIPLNVPRFFDLEVEAGADPNRSAAALLPPAGNRDFYRITFTGYSGDIDLEGLTADFSHFPNLIFRDRTVPEQDLWKGVDEDSLEGLYFRKLRDAMDPEDPRSQRIVRLAARISRSLLDGQEVPLP